MVLENTFGTHRNVVAPTSSADSVIKTGAHERVVRAPAHDAFLRLIFTCVGGAIYLSSYGCRLARRGKLSPIISSAGNMSSRFNGESNPANDITYCDDMSR